MLVVLLGVLSLETIGLASPAALVLGRRTLRHHCGWEWLTAKDALLVACGMVMAALPLLAWLFLLPLLLMVRWRRRLTVAYASNGEALTAGRARPDTSFSNTSGWP